MFNDKQKPLSNQLDKIHGMNLGEGRRWGWADGANEIEEGGGGRFDGEDKAGERLDGRAQPPELQRSPD